MSTRSASATLPLPERSPARGPEGPGVAGVAPAPLERSPVLAATGRLAAVSSPSPTPPLPLAAAPARPGRGLHAAIIMDGNGRWATARGRSRTAGHVAGADAVRRTVETAPRLGIATLTLYAFSSDNWQRPPEEVRALMALFRRYLVKESARCAENGVRIAVIGRRDRLAAPLLAVIESAERATAEAGRLLLRIAVDYSARDAIVRAARRLSEGRPAGEAPAEGPAREEFARLLADPPHDGRPVPDVDLLIRTGGEKRLSDFLLWECAYAELIFTDRMWPDFEARDLEEAVAEFDRRERRFGRVAPAPPRQAQTAAAG